MLWYPTAVAGITVLELAGQKPYLRPSAVAIPALIGLFLLALPLGTLLLAGSPANIKRAAILALRVVILWQVGLAVVALWSRNQDLMAWPLYAQPSEPTGWDGAAVLAFGSLLVASILLLAMLGLTSRRVAPRAARPINRAG
jgi:hypothetical protein